MSVCSQPSFAQCQAGIGVANSRWREITQFQSIPSTFEGSMDRLERFTVRSVFSHPVYASLRLDVTEIVNSFADEISSVWIISIWVSSSLSISISVVF